MYKRRTAKTQLGVSIWFVVAAVLMVGMGIITPLVRPVMMLDAYVPDEDIPGGESPVAEEAGAVPQPA